PNALRVGSDGDQKYLDSPHRIVGEGIDALRKDGAGRAEEHERERVASRAVGAVGARQVASLGQDEVEGGRALSRIEPEPLSELFPEGFESELLQHGVDRGTGCPRGEVSAFLEEDPMSMTRAKFLSMVSSSVALAAASPARLLASSVTIVFTAEAFLRYKNTTFTVHAPGGDVRMNLDDVPTGRPDPYTNQFSLIFSGPKSSKVPEGTYTITHNGLNPFSLHISPAGVRSDGKKLYRADFNILKN